MIKGNDDTRFGRRLESLFWWILRLLPIFVLLIMVLGCYKQNSFWEFFISDGDYTILYAQVPSGILTEFLSIISNNFIVEMVSSIFGLDGILPLFTPYSFFPVYFSYLVSIELFRFFLNVMLFIIRFANNLFDRFMR